MKDHTSGKFSRQVDLVRAKLEKGELAFTDCLSVPLVMQVLKRLNIEFRQTIYVPWVTLWTFLTQVMHAEHTCSFAVTQLIGFLAEQGKRTCTPSTGTYCDARSRLPEKFYAEMVLQSGDQTQHQCPAEWKFHDRSVKVIDGTTATMPDTEDNRAEYPLSDPTREGISFPMLRMLVVFSLSVGTVLDYAIRPYSGKATGELVMLREVARRFTAGDIALGDRGFCSYCDTAVLVQQGVDVVVKPNKSRIASIQLIRRLGKNDALYTWKKPKHKPDSLSHEEFHQLPQQLEIRILTVHVGIPGFRTKCFQVLTTLTDAELYPAEDLAELFRRRWACELFLRDIKTTLGMDVLRCMTPAMVRKEIAVHFLAYNLIRSRMAQAAICGGIRPEQISFKSTLYALHGFQSPCCDQRQQAITIATILYHRVGKQPNRFEPRKVRRRPKPFDLLTQTRPQEKEQILAQAYPLSV